MIVLFSVLLFFSCAKEELTTIETNVETQTANQSNLPLFNQMQTNETEAEKVRSKIRQFRERLKAAADGNVLDKNAGTLTIEEAIWNIEAVLNATYADADVPFEKLAIQTSNIVIPTANGYVSDMEAFNAVTAASAKLAEHYNAIASTYKHPIVIDVELEATANDEITISMKSIITEEPPTTITPVGGCNIFNNTNDYWSWGWDQGRCNNLSGGQGIDAADVLATQLNARIPNPVNTLYFTGVTTTALEPGNYPNPNNATANDDYRDFLMFYCHINTLSQFGCLSPDDMRFYYCSMYDVINQEIPAGESFISIDMWDDYGLSTGNYPLMHRGELTFGTAILCPCPPCPPGTPTLLCPQCC